MIYLKPIEFTDISGWFVDFQKHSDCLEMPSDTAQYIGIFNDGFYTDGILIGYFIIQGYNNTEVEIEQGYLQPTSRHRQFFEQALMLLEEKCKDANYKRIITGTRNRFRAYLKWGKRLGYTPNSLTFSKNLGD